MSRLRIFIALLTAPLFCLLQPAAFALDYQHITDEPQKSGWPLSEAERAYVLKPEYERRPGREIGKHLPQFWPVVPSAGYWSGTAWLDTHAKLVGHVKAHPGPCDVLLVGDSITQQWGSPLDTGTLNPAWKKRFPNLRTVNIGIGGDKTQNVLWRLDHGGVEGLEPKAVVVMIGNNNMFFVPETGVEAAAQGVNMVVANVREKFPQAQIIAARILPCHGPGNTFNENITKTNAALAALKLEADPKVRVLDLTADFSNPDGTLKKELYTPDLIHLSPAGYEVYAERLKPLIEGILGGKGAAAEPAWSGEKTTGAGAPAKPLLLANYYCWYHDGRHSQRPFQTWTYPASADNALAKQAQKPGEPPPNSVFRPLAGLYDSADPEVAEWHVRLAQAAGFDAFLVDWWDTHNGLDQNVDRGIVAAAGKLGFKFALLDERAQFHQKFEDYQAMLARGLKRYKDHPAYLRIEGRPVVYLYQVASKPGLSAEEFPRLKKHVEDEVGPVYWIVDKIAHDAKAANAGDRDREKRIPADWLAVPGVDCFAFYSTFSNFRAHEYADLAGKFRHLTKLAHDAGKKMLLPVHPGHDNSYFVNEPYVMPRRDGQTLRDFLRAATEAGADHLMVTSWNEWPESTVVEPSSSWPDPYLYLRIIAECKGLSFNPPALPKLGR